MAELVIILTDFFSAAPEYAVADLPRLALLETILARARVTTRTSDWRGWLGSRVAGELQCPLPPAGSLASTVARAWDVRPAAGQAAGQLWLATPVHYFAGLDSVHLHPAGLLRLDNEQQHALVADFARVFADSPWRLRSLDQRELLLSGPAIAASGGDPAHFAGSDPSPGLPRGEGAAALRGLGAEIEMWLYEHPLNLERNRRGELPVTTLWLWGAEAIAAATPLPRTPANPAPGARLYGRDTYGEALWRLQGSQAQALPAALDGAAIGGDVDHIFLYSLLQPEGLTAALLQFEQRWLPAALRSLRARRVSVLRLLLGTRAYSLRRLDLARFWRARVPWWEMLA